MKYVINEICYIMNCIDGRGFTPQRNTRMFMSLQLTMYLVVYKLHVVGNGRH